MKKKDQNIKPMDDMDISNNMLMQNYVISSLDLKRKYLLKEFDLAYYFIKDKIDDLLLSNNEHFCSEFIYNLLNIFDICNVAKISLVIGKFSYSIPKDLHQSFSHTSCLTLDKSSDQIFFHFLKDPIYLDDWEQFINKLGLLFRSNTQHMNFDNSELCMLSFHLSNTPFCIIDVNTDICLEANDAFFLSYHLEKKEILGQFTDKISLWNYSGKATSLAELINERELFDDKDYLIIDKKGKAAYKKITAKKIKFRQSDCLFFVSKDITLQKLTAKSYIESEQLFQTLFEESNSAMVLTDLDGNYIKANHAFRTLLGYSELDLLQMDFLQLTSVDFLNESNKNFNNLLEGQRKGYSLEKKYIKKDDGEMWVRVSVSLIHNQKNQPALTLGIIEDISENKAMDQEREQLIQELRISRDKARNNAKKISELMKDLSKSEQKLKQLNSSKDKFFSIIAHDLKNPFTGVIGLSNILHEEIDDLDKDELLEISKAIYSSTNYLYKLLNNLLEWAKLQRGLINFKMGEYNLLELVNHSVNVHKENSAQKNIQINTTIAPDLSVSVDNMSIATVFRNIISNAIKFSNRDSLLEISAMKMDESNIEISFQDFGTGMSADTQKKIFKIDERFSMNGTENERGSGLGLILCKEFIEQNYGSLKVESKLGYGTKFLIQIPASVK